LWKREIKNSGFFIVFTICILLLKSTAVFALEGECNIGFGRRLIIGQERFETSGVLVSRPVPLDEKILDLIIFNNIVSLEDYVQWLQENIKYRKEEGGDHWSTPGETLQNKYGDCEDYAFLNQAVLRVAGYQPKVLAAGKLGRLHAICVFQEGGHYSWIDNTKLRRTQAQSIYEFAKYLFSQYDFYCLVELRFETKDWDILFKRSEIANQTM